MGFIWGSLAVAFGTSAAVIFWQTSAIVWQVLSDQREWRREMLGLGPSLRAFSTSPAISSYTLPVEVEHISTLILRLTDRDIVLTPIAWEYFVQHRQSLRGIPTFYCYDTALHTLYLDPVPDAHYFLVYEAHVAATQRSTAERRAIELLRQWLSPLQLQQYDEKNCFFVRGSRGGHYIIKPAVNFGCEQLDKKGVPFRRLCLHPVNADRFIGDVMLATKIRLETDELLALEWANKATAIPYDNSNYADMTPAGEARARRSFSGRAALDNP